MWNDLENMEERQANREKIRKIWKKIAKRYGKYGRTVSLNVKWYGKYEKNPSWMVKGYGNTEEK